MHGHGGGDGGSLIRVFAGLFALLALRPLDYRGLWELVIANKLMLTVTGLAYTMSGGVAGAVSVVSADGGLTVVLVVAYACCRGWRARPPLHPAGT